jgi:hypothetical protein
MDVVITNPTCPHMILHAMIVATQEKTCSYMKHALGIYFIPLAIKTYGCLHTHFVSFFTTSVQAIVTCHQQSSLVPMMFISYYRQHVSIALQRAHAIAILKCATMLGKHSTHCN